MQQPHQVPTLTLVPRQQEPEPFFVTADRWLASTAGKSTPIRYTRDARHVEALKAFFLSAKPHEITASWIKDFAIVHYCTHEAEDTNRALNVLARILRLAGREDELSNVPELIITGGDHVA